MRTLDPLLEIELSRIESRIDRAEIAGDYSITLTVREARALVEHAVGGLRERLEIAQRQRNGLEERLSDAEAALAEERAKSRELEEKLRR